MYVSVAQRLPTGGCSRTTCTPRSSNVSGQSGCQQAVSTVTAAPRACNPVASRVSITSGPPTSGQKRFINQYHARPAHVCDPAANSVAPSSSTHVGQVAILVLVVEAITDDEFIRNLEADVIGLNLDLLSPLLAHSSTARPQRAAGSNVPSYGSASFSSVWPVSKMSSTTSTCRPRISGSRSA